VQGERAGSANTGKETERHADVDALVLPRGGFGGTTVTLWTPVARSDIAWNFEKFLFDKEGKPVKRYSRYFDMEECAADIDALL